MQPLEPIQFSATCEGWRVRSGGAGGGGCAVVGNLQANHAEAEGRCGARTDENEDLKLAERGYGCCHLLHRGAINELAQVQEDDVGVGLQPAHQLHQLIACQLPEALLFITKLKFSVLPAAAVFAQVYVKWEREGGVEHQLQVLREGHGGGRGGGEVALPKGETLRWRVHGGTSTFFE